MKRIVFFDLKKNTPLLSKTVEDPYSLLSGLEEEQKRAFYFEIKWLIEKTNSFEKTFEENLSIIQEVKRKKRKKKKIIFLFNKTKRKKAEKGIEIKNQIPNALFFNFIDSFFKQITEREFQIMKEDFIDPSLLEIEENSFSKKHTHDSLERRLVSAFVNEKMFHIPETDNVEQIKEEEFTESNEETNEISFRIKKAIEELVGVEVDNENNEIKVKKELFTLGKELQEVSLLNENRKKSLRRILENIIAAQEYYQVLDLIEKQILVSFGKRKKKIKTNPEAKPEKEELELLKMYKNIKEKLNDSFINRKEFYNVSDNILFDSEEEDSFKKDIFNEE